jgi:hypothetical protein
LFTRSCQGATSSSDSTPRTRRPLARAALRRHYRGTARHDPRRNFGGAAKVKLASCRN